MSENVPLNSEQGKATIDSLMAKMTPEQQAQFKESLNSNKPVHVHMDKDGNVLLGDAADEAVPGASEAPVELKKEEQKPPKLSKIDEKRQRIFMARLQRKMGEKNKDGSPKTQQQAVQEIAREDYDALPVEKKLARLEAIVAQTFRNFSEELINLGQGHAAIADAFDINYRAIQKMFLKLGVPNDEQRAIIEEAQKDVIEARKQAQAAHELAQLNQRRAAQEAAEKTNVSAELQPVKEVVEASDGPLPPPKEATVFGG